MEKLKVLVGRSSQCDYTIEKPEQHGTVSGKHATISETETSNVYLFEDHSTNGSYINGQLIHNDECKINVTDHITLGKTYTLPFEDIVKRYFMSHRTTKKKPQQPEPQIQIVETPQPEPINYINPEPQIITEIKTVEKVPTWFWILLIGATIAAFFIGTIM